jgi:hypothetical protein
MTRLGIEVIDRRTQALVWSADVELTASEPLRDEPSLRVAVDRALRDYPDRSSAPALRIQSQASTSSSL